jgi:benzoate-CoA ligase
MILLPDCPEFIYAFFGAIKIGAVAVPVNTLLTPADYEYLLTDSRARVLVVHERLRERISGIAQKYLEHVIVVDDSFQTLLAPESEQLAAEDMSPDAAAFWLYSSGTTGFPKGAVLRGIVRTRRPRNHRT